MYKPVYQGRPWKITKLAFVDRWPLFAASKLPIRFSRDELRLAIVDRKPLLAGVLMYRFHSIWNVITVNRIAKQRYACNCIFIQK